MNCRSTDCDAPAVATMFWPGNEGAVCLRCALGWGRVAKAMGFTLRFGPLEMSTEPLAKEVERALIGADAIDEEGPPT